MESKPARELSVAEAKARFADCLRAAERGEPTVITRHGRRVAVIVPMGDLERLRPTRVEWDERGLASLACGFEGSEELAEFLEARRRTRRRRARR